VHDLDARRDSDRPFESRINSTDKHDNEQAGRQLLSAPAGSLKATRIAWARGIATSQETR
jgi:hypothetical protein